jgi:hypothetical protein
MPVVSDVSLRSRFRPADDVVFRNVDGETVILSIGSGLYFGLTPTGTRIWELIDEERALTEILEVLLAEYEVTSGEAQRDLLSLVSALDVRGLVTPAPSGSEAP